MQITLKAARVNRRKANSQRTTIIAAAYAIFLLGH